MLTIVANITNRYKEKLLEVNSIALPGWPYIIPANGIMPGWHLYLGQLALIGSADLKIQ